MRDKLPQTGYTKLPEPTKIEVEVALEMLSEKYHNAFSYDDAAKFLTLSKELQMWQEIEKGVDAGKQITKKDAKMTQQIYKQMGEKISLERANLEAKKGTIIAIAREVLRITSELEDLVNAHLA